MALLKICCEKLRDATTVSGTQKLAAIEYVDGFNVNGCCGGGCYVLSDLEFCPFCGTKFEFDELIPGYNLPLA